MSLRHHNRSAVWRIAAVLLCAGIFGCSFWATKQRMATVPQQTLVPGGRHVIPMDAINGIPFVQVYVNGQGPYRFVLDTGSTGLMISLELVAEINPPREVPAVEVILETPEGGYNFGCSRHVEVVKFGHCEFRELHAAVADTRTVFQSYGKVDGVLGVRVFANCQLTIDYPKNQLILIALDEAKPLSVEDDEVLPLKPVLHHRFAVPVRIVDKTLWCLLDPGHEDGIVVPEEMAATLPLASPPVKVPGSIMTFSGKLPIRQARLKGSAWLGLHELLNPSSWYKERHL